MMFTDMEKAYDKVSREILWECLKQKGVLVEYILAIKDRYERAEMHQDLYGGHKSLSNKHRTPSMVSFKPFSFHYCVR